MADLKLEGADLKKMVKLGKTKRPSFAFCPGEKDDHTMIIDRRKKPEMLGKAARNEGAGKKAAFGYFELNGRNMELTCSRVIPKLAKTLKKYLKTQKIKVNVVVMDEDGTVLDSDIEDLPPDPTMDDADDDQFAADAPAAAPGDAGPGQRDADKARALATRLKAAQPAIAGAPGDAAAKLKQAAAAAIALIKSADYEKADKTIAALEAAAAKLSAKATDAPAQEADGDARDLRPLAARANALKEAIAGVQGPAKDKLMAALAGAVGLIKSHDHDGADSKLGQIEAAINKMAAAPGATGDTSGSEGASPIEKSRDTWVQTRSNLENEIQGLKAEIDKVTASIDGLSEVPSKSPVLLSYLDGFDDELEKALDALSRAQDDAQREKLRETAGKIVEKYKGVLDTEFFKAVDNNGFVKTNIRGAALDTLNKVSAAIAA